MHFRTRRTVWQFKILKGALNPSPTDHNGGNPHCTGPHVPNGMVIQAFKEISKTEAGQTFVTA